MINRAEFRFNDSVHVDVPSQLSPTTIYLRMRGIHSEQTSLYPISGFPRNLIAEDMINGTSPACVRKSHLLTPTSESRLDKRAELIKERRYGGLAVANDPKVALSRDGEGDGDQAPEPPIKETQDTTTGQDPAEKPLARVDSAETTSTNNTTTSASASSTGRRSNSQASSQTLVSRLSDSSASSAARSHVSIADLRAQTRNGNSSPMTIKDGNKLASNISTLSLSGSNALGLGWADSDLGSDDSDGPPSEAEVEPEPELDGEEETETETDTEMEG